MLSTFVTIGQAIKKAVPEIRSVDLNKGQLDPGRASDFESLSCPAILVGNSDVNWAALGQGHEQGDGEVSVCYVIRLASRTSLIDPLLFKSLEQLEMANDINAAVKAVPGITSRTSSHEYASGPYYVVEQVYGGFFKSTPPPPITKQVGVMINPLITNPSTPK